MMETLARQLLSGFASGSIYASVALALVIIHRSTHLVNFAQGEMATFSTYLAWSLIDYGVPYWAAFFLTVGASFLIGILIERLVVRPVGQASALAVVIVFVGLLLIFNSLAGWIFTSTLKVFPSPFSSEPFFGQHYISPHELGAAGVTLLVLAVLYAFFQFTSLGLAMRATAYNPASSRLVGIRVGRMLALGWGLAAAVGAIAGMMVAPVVFLEPNMMSGILIYAFAGALLGGISHPVGAVCGGYAIGVVETLMGAYLVGNELKLTVALAVIVLVLTVRPAGLFGKNREMRI